MSFLSSLGEVLIDDRRNGAGHHIREVVSAARENVQGGSWQEQCETLTHRDRTDWVRISP